MLSTHEVHVSVRGPGGRGKPPEVSRQKRDLGLRVGTACQVTELAFMEWILAGAPSDSAV